MAGSQNLTRLIRGIAADVADYRMLQELLEAQFAAALRHQSERLKELAEHITGLTEAMEQRRRERVGLACSLLGDSQPVSMDAVFELLPAASRESMQSWWRMLEGLVNECKALNTRNCRLIMDQHEIMQRVLGAEGHTYAPV